jgi:hypothetical protein
MKWSSGGRSGDLEDRRAGGVSRTAMIGGGGGIIGLVVALIVGLSGGEMPAGFGQAPAAQQTEFKATPEEEKLVDFVSWVLDDIQKTWTGEFQKRGRTYQRAKLVLFRDQVDSACGRQGAAVGPFYCPGDQKAYIDLSFYALLQKRFGAPGDFAQAYVIAHEIGHHIQNLVGTSDKVARLQSRDPSSANAYSVKLELQADCLAGVWAHYTATRGSLEPGDIEEGLRAASAIGDDALQKGAGQAVRPESFTHGSSADRVKWFTRGYQSGREEDCETGL